VEQDALVRCPYCAESIAAVSPVCPICRTDLRLPLPPEPGPTVTHEGLRYRLGYDRLSFVLWDAKTPGGYVARFPKTDEGWVAAWRAFQRQEAWHRPGWPRKGLWILVNAVIGLVGISFAVLLILTGFVALFAPERLDLHGAFVFPLSTIAFLLLIYLPVPTRTRLWVFVLVIVLASIATVITSPWQDPALEEFLNKLD
jgi:hypothetical protein